MDITPKPKINTILLSRSHVQTYVCYCYFDVIDLHRKFQLFYIGYNLVEFKSHRCQATGIWSRDVLTCQRKFFCCIC